MRSIYLAPFAWLLGLAAACGGSDTGGFTGGPQGGEAGQPGDDKSMVSIADLSAKYASALCEAYTNCAGDLYAIFRPGEDCVSNTTTTLTEELATLPNAIARGTVVYHDAELQGCLDEISGGDCSTLSNRLPASCKAAIEGTVAEGAECSLDGECKGEQYCKLGDACPGQCAPYEQAGGACTGNGDCASGLKCGVTGRCVTPSGEGEACKQGEPDCVDGYACLGEDSTQKTPGKCVTISAAFSGKLAGSCGLGTNLCTPGLSCEIKTLATLSGDCVAKVASGAVCHVAVPDECPDTEYCVLANVALPGKCTPKPAAGEKCGAGLGDGKVCAAGARCDNEVCHETAHAGEECHANDSCYSGQCVANACVTGDSCE